MGSGDVLESTSAGTTSLADAGELGRQLRIDSIRMADEAGSGHPTSSMSAADLIAVLAGRHLVVDPHRPDDPRGDRLVFSKGHASPLLYATLSRIGVLGDTASLDGYRQAGSPLEGHPTPRVPGVPLATGSLGVGLPAAVGLAVAARDLDHTGAHVWVLCGDSEMAEGSMWESIEHAGWLGLANLTVLLDVNRLGQTGPTRHEWDLDAYATRVRAFGWEAITLDGHDVAAIDGALRSARGGDRPTAVVAKTHKGSGVAEVEDAEQRHGKPLPDADVAIEALGGERTVRVVPPAPEGADRAPSKPPRRPAELPTWDVGEEVATRDAFGKALAAVGEAHGDIVGLDGEVSDSTRLEEFAAACPDRFFQAYIAEQLMIGMATGFQVTGWHPFAATFAAFVTRAHDLLRMASIGGANMCIVGSHAGVSIGPDGPSQMGLEDVSMMRAIHGSTVLYPCDANQTAALVSAIAERTAINYLRTSRGPTPVIYEPGTQFRVGRSHVLRSSSGDDVTIVAAGVTVHEALAAADRLASDGVTARVIDAYSIKPIDVEVLERAASETTAIVVVEDHHPEGGLGEAVLSALATHHPQVPVRHLAVRHMPGSAPPEQQREEAGIDADAIARAAAAKH